MEMSDGQQSEQHLSNTETKGRVVRVAVCQFSCGDVVEENVKKAEEMVREAAKKGANIILLQELFAAKYFPIDQMDWSHLAVEQGGSNFLLRFQALAKELNVVLPISFFEQSNNVFYNSVVMFDSDGANLGTYRKSHIPDGPGYQEKFYFSPGQTGFKVFATRHGRVGVAICWDQWFPECARCMVLRGAEVLLYPTAIGSEPHDASLNSEPHWRRCMQGHAAANMVPVAAANRIGVETSAATGTGTDARHQITFYGSSFVTDHLGDIVARAPRDKEQIVVASFDLNDIRKQRVSWGLFRDRRPDLYAAITTLDGVEQVRRREDDR